MRVKVSLLALCILASAVGFSDLATAAEPPAKGGKSDCADILGSEPFIITDTRDFRDISPLRDTTKIYFDNVAELARRSIPQSTMLEHLGAGYEKAVVNWKNAKALMEALKNEAFEFTQDGKGNAILTVTTDVPAEEKKYYSERTTDSQPDKRRYLMQIPGIGRSFTKGILKTKAILRFKPTYDDAENLFIFFETSLEAETEGNRAEVARMAKILEERNTAAFISTPENLQLLPEYQQITTHKMEVSVRAFHLRNEEDLAALDKYLASSLEYSKRTLKQVQRVRLRLQDGQGVSIHFDSVTGKRKIGITPAIEADAPQGKPRTYVYDLDEPTTDQSVIGSAFTTEKFWRSLKSYEVIAEEFSNQISFMRTLIGLYQAEGDANYRTCILEGLQAVAEYLVVPAFAHYQPVSSAKLRGTFAKAFLEKWAKLGLKGQEPAAYVFFLTEQNPESRWSWRLESLFTHMRIQRTYRGPQLVSDSKLQHTFLFIWNQFDDGYRIVLLRPGQGFQFNGEPMVLEKIRVKQTNEMNMFSEYWLKFQKIGADGKLVSEEVLYKPGMHIAHSLDAKELIELKRQHSSMEYKPQQKFDLPAMNKDKTGKDKKWLN